MWGRLKVPYKMNSQVSGEGTPCIRQNIYSAASSGGMWDSSSPWEEEINAYLLQLEPDLVLKGCAQNVQTGAGWQLATWNLQKLVICYSGLKGNVKINTAEVNLCFLELCLFHWLKAITYCNSKQNNPDSANINGKIGSEHVSLTASSDALTS